MELSDQQKTDLVTLGSLRWEDTKIAAFFGWDLKELRAQLDDSESEISRLLLKGELEAQFKLESKILAQGQGGDLASAREFRSIVRDRSFKLSKLDLFGGAEDKTLFDKIQGYYSNGAPDNLSTKEQLYIDVLQMVYSLSIKFGDRKTIKLLTEEPYCLKFDRAKDMIAEAVELFNGGRRTTKDAMRHHMAETYDTLYHMILDNAKTNQDLALAATVLDKKAKLLRLDEPDVEILPPERYSKIYRVLSLTTESLGLPVANRDELAAQIEALEIPEVEKRRLRMESGVDDVDIVKMLENVVQEKS